MTVLYTAELVGKAGVYAFRKGFAELKRQRKIDFTIVCADGATGGSGLGRIHAGRIHKLGAQVITTGECCFYKKDLVENFDKINYVLRPANLNPEAPGIGIRVFRLGDKSDVKIAVVVFLGQSGFSRMHGNSPVSGLSTLMERIRQETPYIVIDFHAGPTAEKQTFFAAADGRCSAVIGSHTRVQTADERVLPLGTAVITDAGRTGSTESVGGSSSAPRIQEYLSGIRGWTHEAWDKPELQGVLIELKPNGKAASIERVRVPVSVPDMPPETNDRNRAGEEDGSEEEELEG
ncbi:MAG: YmdB family metallophosphoesterase [Treponema sp.]|jgi:metallophosphoesterase (TIGR00282 family)|nr:YmdB family metallophosphoesterase [Treponema sp.]